MSENTEKAFVINSVSVGDIVRLNERRYRFSITARVISGGLFVIHDCVLIGPKEDGTFKVYGPSRTNEKTGHLRQLVRLPRELRETVLELAIAARDEVQQAEGGAA